MDTIDEYFIPTAEELAALTQVFRFEGEEILRVPDAWFMGARWDTVIGFVHGKVYKISIQLNGARAEVGRVNRQIYVLCTKLYGNGSGFGGGQVWDASDGNIFLNSVNFGGQATINVTVTSAKVSQFRRV